MASAESRSDCSDGQIPPGKTCALMKLVAPARRQEGAVGLADRLDGGQPVGGEKAAAHREVGVEVLPADRLDHLDGHQLGEAAAEVAVVLEEHRDPVLETVPAHPLGGQPVLLGADRGGGDPAAVVLGGVHRQRAPAAADLHQVVRRARAAACGRAGRSWRSTRRAGWPARSRRCRSSTTWCRRASARTGRCRCRSAGRCSRGCGRGCCDAATRRRCGTGRSTGATAAWTRSSVSRLRMARRTSATRSSQSQAPSA